MFKNNRTNFRALIENLKEKARLTKEKRSIKRGPEQGKDIPKSDKDKR
jgi:hypothetical protein